MSTPSRPRVVVIGGGLAGLSAAVTCAERGVAVTLLEARPRLGGATWSFLRRDLWFDNGQHVHLRCCEAYRSFLERLGTAELAPLAGPLAIPVVSPAPPRGTASIVRSSASGEVAWIKRSSLPAPAHLGRSLLSYRHLGVADRLRLLPAALALRFVRLGDPRLDSETFADWLRRHGQSERAIARLWDLITLPTTNLRCDEVSLVLAAKVFLDGLLRETAAADIGWSRVPLAQLHVEPARRLLESCGADVRTGAKVTEIVAVRAGDRWRARGVVVGGEIVEAEAVVLAVPHEAAAGLLPGEALSRPERLRQLGTVPIVNVHLVFDRKVMPYAVAAGVGSPTQFVFDRTAAAEGGALEGRPDRKGRQVLAVSLSGADEEIGQRPETLIEDQLASLRALFPAARAGKVLDAVVTREHDATFRGVPGSGALRPGPGTRMDNLALAGAWTDTGWPATMEGAVRSGRAAAEHVVRSVGYRGSPSPRMKEKAA